MLHIRETPLATDGCCINKMKIMSRRPNRLQYNVVGCYSAYIQTSITSIPWPSSTIWLTTPESYG